MKQFVPLVLNSPFFVLCPLFVVLACSKPKPRVYVRCPVAGLKEGWKEGLTCISRLSNFPLTTDY